MLIDINRMDAGTQIDCDICILGSGPAGISVARALKKYGLRIVIAESGGQKTSADLTVFDDGESVGYPLGLSSLRRRVFGGSGTAWGGRCVEMDPIDFESRPWISNSGWPISYETLHPYYRRAWDECNLRGPWGRAEGLIESLGQKLPDFTGLDIQPFLRRMAPRSRQRLGYTKNFDWAEEHLDEFQSRRDVRVLVNATHVGFSATTDGSAVKSATIRSLNGPTASVSARAFVLACGGLENPRALLNAPPVMLGRINRHDQVGRCLAQHPRGVIATVDADSCQADRLQRLFNAFIRPTWDPYHYELGFELSETAQKQNKLLNACVWMRYTAGEDSAWTAGRRLRDALVGRKPLSQSGVRDLGTLLAGLPSEARNVWSKYVIAHELLHRKPLIECVIDLEQVAHPESRVMLADSLDPFGNRRWKVDWRLGALERTTSLHFARSLEGAFKRWKLGTLNLRPWLMDDAPLSPADLHGSYHLIGATRMAATPERGVVNSNCRVFGVDNLYVAGASVFSTGGHANPTLTIVALALRLGDHLGKQFGQVTSSAPTAVTEAVDG